MRPASSTVLLLEILLIRARIVIFNELPPPRPLAPISTTKSALPSLPPPRDWFTPFLPIFPLSICVYILSPTPGAGEFTTRQIISKFFEKSFHHLSLSLSLSLSLRRPGARNHWRSFLDEKEACHVRTTLAAILVKGISRVRIYDIAA